MNFLSINVTIYMPVFFFINHDISIKNDDINSRSL